MLFCCLYVFVYVCALCIATEVEEEKKKHYFCE